MANQKYCNSNPMDGNAKEAVEDYLSIFKEG
jgi:hypothetical protein